MDPLEEPNSSTEHVYSSAQYEVEPTIYISTEDEVNDICRICLQNNAFLDWNNEIMEFCGTTFKSFYYKLTQLKLIANDPHPIMLCEACSIEMKGAYILMMKALESHACLRERDFNDTKIDIENDTKNPDHSTKPIGILKGINNLVKQNDELVKAIGKLHKTLQKDGNKNNGETVSASNKNNFEGIAKKRRKSLKQNKNEESQINFNVTGDESQEDEIYDNEKCSYYEEILSDSEISNDFKSLSNGKYNNKTDSANINEISNNFSDHDTDSGKAKETFMCAYCPRILANKTSLIRHEETHDNNRERKATCPDCGVKCFTQFQLRMHMRIHRPDREKKYKCEYCDKAYYERGALNIHRRKHLGQMLPCTSCSKEFYRQSDLDVHNIKAHGMTPLHGNVKTRTKYYVHCDECNKTMRTTSWKEHQANHRKEPLLKCSLCDIDFCSRCACLWHMSKVHGYKKKNEYEEHIMYLKDKRLSHRLLKQQDILLPNTT